MKVFKDKRAGKDEQVDGAVGEPAPDRRPFDKKSYRIRKYSNKYKLDKWEENRRRNALGAHRKEMRSDPSFGRYAPFDYDGEDDGESRVRYAMHPDVLEKLERERRPDGPRGTRPFERAKAELAKLREDRRAESEAARKVREEKSRALEAYRTKKSDKFKKLSKRTKTGQPLMRDRMRMLLDDIQKATGR